MSKFQKFLIALAGAAVILSLGLSLVALKANFNAGSAINTNVDAYVNGLQTGDLVEFSKYVAIPAGSNQASWKNKLGRDVYVDLAMVSTTGTASSTYRIVSGTSTSATIADFSAPTTALTSLLSFSFATSSVATTTNSLHGTGASVGVVKVADGEYVNFALLQGSTGAPSTACPSVGGACESATSTNRGFNLQVRFHATYKK